MAGVSSYAPKEIEFVLKSIVQKHKPGYIIETFVRRFNKTLNQNQIRYIKNKYGKDPGFGSPMVNYKGGNARDLKNFRRQKAQNRRLTDADGDESASEYEASGSQAYAAATPSLNMENTHHCYPSPRATLSPHGTSFLGGNTNSFNFFQPHMLLTQAESTSNTAPQQLGTASGLVPFVPSQAGDNGANEPAFEDQGLEGPSAVLGTLHGVTYQNAYTNVDGSNDTKVLSNQQYQYLGEPTVNHNAREMARLYALSTPLDLHESLGSTPWTQRGTNMSAVSKSPGQHVDMQSPVPASNGEPVTVHSKQPEVAAAHSQPAQNRQREVHGSDDAIIKEESQVALPTRGQNVRRPRTSRRAVPKPRASRVQGTAQKPIPWVLKPLRNTDPWHRLPPGVKGKRPTRPPGRCRARAPYPQLPNFPVSLEDLVVCQGIRRDYKRQTTPDHLNRRAEKLQSRSREASNNYNYSPAIRYNMGPPGAIVIVDSPVPNGATFPGETPTTSPANIEPPTAIYSDNNQSAVFTVVSNDTPSQSTSTMANTAIQSHGCEAAPGSHLANQTVDNEDLNLQAFLQEFGQDGNNPTDWNFDLNDYENANNDASAYDGVTFDSQNQNHQEAVPPYLIPQSSTGLDYTSFNTTAFVNESTADVNTANNLYHDRDALTGYQQGYLYHTTPLFLQPMPDQVHDSFDNQFLDPQPIGETSNSNTVNQHSLTTGDWHNVISEPLDPKMFEGLTSESLPDFDTKTTKF